MTYLLKKVRVYPKENIDWSEKAYLGMSMGNRIFQSPESLIELWQYIASHTSHLTILVGDHLHRYNLQIFEGLSEKSAIDIAEEQGRRLVNIFMNTIGHTSPKEYHFLYTKSLMVHFAFDSKMTKFKMLYDSDPTFAALIEYTVNVFLRRHKEIKVSTEKAKNLCRLYLFEELVIFEILASEGYKVNIYPGNQLPIIKEIVTGKLKNVSEQLESIQAVEVKFRPKQIVHTQ